MTFTVQLKLTDVYDTTYLNRRTGHFEFSENDFVWLSTANLLLRNQECTKFRQRFNSPHAIFAKISSQAYRLRLPLSMQCHNVFHISKLKPYHSPD
jgi:hypothetical protein